MAFEKIDAKQQRKITNDWLELFPSYKRETSRSISRRIGPLLLSIWYQMGTGSCQYYIKFTECALLEENQKYLGFVLESVPTSRTGLPWLFHEQGIYKRLAQELRAVAFVPMEGPVTLSQIINAYKDKVSKEWMGEQALEDVVLIPAWAGKEELAQELLEWTYDLFMDGITKPERIDHIKKWRDVLEHRLKDPERLREIVNENVERLKLTKIPYEELVIDC